MSKFEAFTEEDAADIICTAFYGNFWFYDEGYKVFPIKLGEEGNATDVKVKGEEVKAEGLVNKDTLTQAARDILSGKIKVNSAIKSDIENERQGCDADSADALLQVVLFGELVYG